MSWKRFFQGLAAWQQITLCVAVVLMGEYGIAYATGRLLTVRTGLFRLAVLVILMTAVILAGRKVAVWRKE